jgi:hypothetical protein
MGSNLRKRANVISRNFLIGMAFTAGLFAIGVIVAFFVTYSLMYCYGIPLLLIPIIAGIVYYLTRDLD